MKTRISLAFISLFLLFAYSNLKGQDSLARKKGPDYAITFNASGRVLSGTFNQSVYAAGLDIKLTWKRWELHNTASYRYNNFAGTQVEDNWYQLFRFSYLTQNSNVHPVVFYLFDNNLLFRVNARHLTGFGINWRENKWKHTSIRLDAGFGYENTSYDGTTFENTDSTDPIREKPLFLFYLIHKHDFLKEKIKITNTVVYRQSLIEGPDFYLLIRPQLLLGIVKNLSVNFSYEYRFENVYLSDLSGTNTVLLAGLTYSLTGKKD